MKHCAYNNKRKKMRNIQIFPPRSPHSLFHLQWNHWKSFSFFFFVFIFSPFSWHKLNYPQFFLRHKKKRKKKFARQKILSFFFNRKLFFSYFLCLIAMKSTRLAWMVWEKVSASQQKRVRRRKKYIFNMIM